MTTTRKFKPIDPELFRAVAESFKRKEMSAEQAADRLGISRANFYDRLRVAGYIDTTKNHGFRGKTRPRAPGTHYGRPFKPIDPVLFLEQVDLYKSGKTSQAKAAAALGVSLGTFRNRYKEQKPRAC